MGTNWDFMHPEFSFTGFMTKASHSDMTEGSNSVSVQIKKMESKFCLRQGQLFCMLLCVYVGKTVTEPGKGKKLNQSKLLHVEYRHCRRGLRKETGCSYWW